MALAVSGQPAVGALALLLAILLLPNDRDETRPRELDWMGLALLSPALVLVLYGSERITQTIGREALAAGIVMLAGFLWMAARKGDRALIDLRLFKGKIFSASALTQFLANGAMIAGQMLIPVYLIQACGRSPGEMGWMLAPLGLGMMITFPLMGTLTRRFGVRRLSAAGAAVTLLATLAFIYLSLYGLNLLILMPALFFRGMGQGAISVPSISAAYAAIDRRDLPMATTSLNIVQRLGGPIFTTLYATFLAWRLGLQAAPVPVSTGFAWTFLLLAGLHALALIAAFRLPLRIGGRRQCRRA